MGGCYGGSKEDRYFESLLFNYLDDTREDYFEVCPNCGGELSLTETGLLFCEECGWGEWAAYP